MIFSKTKFLVLPCCTMSALFQSKHDELEAKFIEERAALEAKYQKLYEPLYSKVNSSLFYYIFFGKLLIIYFNPWIYPFHFTWQRDVSTY